MEDYQKEETKIYELYYSGAITEKQFLSRVTNLQADYFGCY
jgi:hypothetical protein